MKKGKLLSLILLALLTMAGQTLGNGNFQEAEKFFKAQEFKKAIDILEALTNKDPSYAEAWALLGDCYGVTGKDKNAIKDYQQAIRLNPANERALFGLGTIHSKREEYEEAIEAYKRVIQINPMNADAHFGLGVSYDNTSSIGKAFEQYKILKTLDENLANKLYHIIFY